VTDFLGRLAARAVGVGTAARPRLAGLFEPAAAAGDATLEVVDEEVVAPGPAPQARETPAAKGNGRRAAPPAQAQRAQLAPPANPAEVPAAPRPSPRPDSVAQSNYGPAPPPGISPRAAEPEPVTVPRSERSLPAPVDVAPLAQALPAAGAREAAALPAAAAPPRREEPPVRVHIGRLEVRANIQPPPPERPRREPPRPEGLSLADYLRGQREVRS
jgi:hypothetical protein